MLVCPRRNWTEILSNLFSELDKQKLALVPHYMLKGFDPSTDSLFVSFRIFRKQEHEKPIKDLVEKLLKDQKHEFDPKEPSPLAQCHDWRGTVGWTREKCEIMSKISRLALEIINVNTSKKDRLEGAHDFSNMIAIFDWEKSFHCPETFPSICTLKYHQS